MSLTGPPYDSRNARFVYDLAFPGDYRYWKFVYSNLNQQDITLSASTEYQRVNETFGATGTRATACEFESVVTDTTQATILHEGDNTAFDEEFITTTDYNAIVMDIQYNFAVALNVSAFTSGNFNIDSVDLTMQSFKAQNTLAHQFSKTWATGFTALGAAGNQVLIVQDVIKEPFPIYRGGAIITQIVINETTGTGTRQVGILPVIPYQATGALRIAGESGYRSLLQPMPSRREVLTEGPYARY